ncbi:MAG: aminoglycoside phosphotransferase family protein [Clostridia bacterium]|nr:aminoglycoside phosphotransferase family protein [Clostridia bacterium]MBO7170489.1 aminoglycoside phosphotransferase family protein [Clostridia bacterium]
MDHKSLLENAYGVTFTTKLYGNGHINKTYLSEGSPRILLQQINTTVFSDPEGMMGNILAVTDYLKKLYTAEGKDASRYTLTVAPTLSGNSYVQIENCFYRAYEFIEGTVSYDMVTPETLEKAGFAFGKFGKDLADFPAETLCEVIPNFHNTPSRFADLCRAVEKDARGRAAEDAEEIRFYMAHEAFCHTVTDRIADGRIPLAVTHNDTKINNILFDQKTGEALAVVDLDTVMPGSRLYDFGDALRTGAATAAEDEEDLSLVGFDPEKFRAFTRGYLAAAGDALSPDEIALLPESALLLTIECGMRFLADDLNGDVYFRIHKDRHNLIRARNQIKQACEIEKMLPLLHDIVNDCLQ